MTLGARVERVLELAELADKTDHTLDKEHGIDRDLGVDAFSLATRERLFADNQEEQALISFLESLPETELDELHSLMYVGRDGGSLEETDKYFKELGTPYEHKISAIKEKRPALSYYFQKGLAIIGQPLTQGFQSPIAEAEIWLANNQKFRSTEDFEIHQYAKENWIVAKSVDCIRRFESLKNDVEILRATLSNIQNPEDESTIVTIENLAVLKAKLAGLSGTLSELAIEEQATREIFGTLLSICRKDIPWVIPVITNFCKLLEFLTEA